MKEEAVESLIQKRKKSVTKPNQQNMKRKREATVIHADGKRSQKVDKVRVSYTYLLHFR